MNIESKLWKIRASAPHMIAIIQKASGAMRFVTQSHLPALAELAAISERQFDRVCREAFHSAAMSAPN
jgi:hypothetical protein